MSDFNALNDLSITFKSLRNYAFYGIDLFLSEPLDLSNEEDVRQYLLSIFGALLENFNQLMALPEIRELVMPFMKGECNNFVNIFMNLYFYMGQYGLITSKNQLILSILHMNEINGNISKKAFFELMDYCMYESCCTLLLRAKNEQSNSFSPNSLLIEKKIKNNYFIQGACVKIDNLLENPEVFYQEPFFWPLTLVEEESAIQFSKKLNEFFILVLEEDIKEIFGNPSEKNLLLNSPCEFSVNFNLYRFIIEQWWQLQRMNVPYQQAISMLKIYIRVHRSFFDYLEYDFQILLNNPLTGNINGLIELMKKGADKAITIDDGRLFVFAISVFPLCLEFIARESRLHWIINTCLDMNKGLYSSSLYRLCEVLNYLFAKKSPDDFLQCFETREQLFVRMVRTGCSLEFILKVLDGGEYFNSELCPNPDVCSYVPKLTNVNGKGDKFVYEVVKLLKSKIDALTVVDDSGLFVFSISVFPLCLEFITREPRLHWIINTYLDMNKGLYSSSHCILCEVLNHLFAKKSQGDFLQCFENREELFVRMIRMECSLEFISMVLDGDEHFNNKFHFNSNTYLCVSAIMRINRYTTEFIKLLLFEPCHVDWSYFENLSLRLLETSFNFANFVFSCDRSLEEEMKVEIFGEIISISLNLKANEDSNIISLFEGIRKYWWSGDLSCLKDSEILSKYKKFIDRDFYFKNSKFLDDKSKFFKHRDRKFLETFCDIEESCEDVGSILGCQTKNLILPHLLHILNKLNLSKDYKQTVLKAYVAYHKNDINMALYILKKEECTRELVEFYHILKNKFGFSDKLSSGILFIFVITISFAALSKVMNSNELCVAVKGLFDRYFCTCSDGNIDVIGVFSLSSFIASVIFCENSEEIIEILLDKYQYLDQLIRDVNYICLDLLLKLILEEKETNYKRFENFYPYNIRLLNHFIKRGHTYLEKFLLDKNVNWCDIPCCANSMLFECIVVVAVVFEIDPNDKMDELRIALFKLLLTLNIPLYEYITNEDILVYAVVRMQRMSPNPTYDTILNVIFNNKELNVRTLLEERRLNPRFDNDYTSTLTKLKSNYECLDIEEEFKEVKENCLLTFDQKKQCDENFLGRFNSSGNSLNSRINKSTQRNFLSRNYEKIKECLDRLFDLSFSEFCKENRIRLFLCGFFKFEGVAREIIDIFNELYDVADSVTCFHQAIFYALMRRFFPIVNPEDIFFLMDSILHSKILEMLIESGVDELTIGLFLAMISRNEEKCFFVCNFRFCYSETHVKWECIKNEVNEILFPMSENEKQLALCFEERFGNFSEEIGGLRVNELFDLFSHTLLTNNVGNAHARFYPAFKFMSDIWNIIRDFEISSNEKDKLMEFCAQVFAGSFEHEKFLEFCKSSTHAQFMFKFTKRFIGLYSSSVEIDIKKLFIFSISIHVENSEHFIANKILSEIVLSIVSKKLEFDGEIIVRKAEILEFVVSKANSYKIVELIGDVKGFLLFLDYFVKKCLFAPLTVELIVKMASEFLNFWSFEHSSEKYFCLSLEKSAKIDSYFLSLEKSKAERDATTIVSYQDDYMKFYTEFLSNLNESSFNIMKKNLKHFK